MTGQEDDEEEPIFFILTDPHGAAKLGRNLGAFIDDQVEAVVEFLDCVFSENPPERTSGRADLRAPYPSGACRY